MIAELAFCKAACAKKRNDEHGDVGSRNHIRSVLNNA
jgi:hypothetical protein